MESDAAAHQPNEDSTTPAPNNNSANVAAASSVSSPPTVPRIKQEMIEDEEEENDVMEGAEQQQQDEDASQENSQQDDEDEDVVMEEEEQIYDGDYQIAESDYTVANKIKFALLCQTLECLWEKKKATKDRWSNERKLTRLLPKKLFQTFKSKRGDYYPLMRLIMPEIDTVRPNLGMQEKTIAQAWSTALGE